MRAYVISRFLYRLNTSPALRERWQANRAATLRESEWALSAEEIDLIEAMDFRRLYQLGIHPLLLTALANCSGVPVPQMIAAIRDLARDPVG